MLALAILAAITAQTDDIDTDDLIALTVPEVRRLINALIMARPPDPAHILRWSYWRRHHQAQARTSHYKRRHQAELSS